MPATAILCQDLENDKMKERRTHLIRCMVVQCGSDDLVYRVSAIHHIHWQFCCPLIFFVSFRLPKKTPRIYRILFYWGIFGSGSFSKIDKKHTGEDPYVYNHIGQTLQKRHHVIIVYQPTDTHIQFVLSSHFVHFHISNTL